ncbi:MAG: GAF domain-containing protein [Chloroflexi bacterium]|nr:GAF domain-containing protein [Chloroflexota bacterium]
MSTWVKRLFAPPIFEDDEDKTRNAALLNAILWAAFTMVAAAAPILILFNEDRTGMILSAVMVAVFSLVVLSLIWMLRRGRVRLTGTLLASFLLVIITATIYTFGGIRNTTVSGYLLVIFIAGLLLGGRAALVFGLLSILAALGVFGAERFGTIPIPFAAEVDFDSWGMLFALSGLTAVLVGLAHRGIANALERARHSERTLIVVNKELEASRDELRVHAQNLERRATRLRAAAQVAHDATIARDLDELLDQAADMIRERFGFYHVGIFLVDDRGEQAVLRAAAGEAGSQMLEQRYRLKVGEAGAVGYVTAAGLSRTIQDVGGDAAYLDNPLLPETRSEMTLPLRVGEEIVGALDVQSREMGVFDEEDVMIFQTMADQLAVAIQNTRLLRDMKGTVRELEVVSGRYTQEAWRVERSRGYRYRGLGVEPVSEQPQEVDQAWLAGSSVISGAEDGRDDTGNRLAVPVKLRDQVIGVLSLRFEGDPASPETVLLVEEIADRLAIALESARLLEETQSRAQRERTIRKITEQMRRAVDVETILQTTIAQLGEAVGAPRVYVRLSAEVEKEK